MIYDNIVIGSGVSALGCILGLLKSKKKVLCIDGAHNQTTPFEKNRKQEMMFCKQNLPLKFFSFQRKSKKFFDPIEVLEHRSFGGLSNVWGANCLRLLKNDFDEWPISYDALSTHYETCEKIMNVSHFGDEISNELKISQDIIDNSKLSLFSNFIKSFFKKTKNSNGFILGYARVALDSRCYKCSNCFFGCSDNYIFSTKNYLEKLINEKQIEYKKNLNLKKFIVKDKFIELEFENSNDTKIFTKKLFIGAGPIQTPRIIINSLKNKKDLNLKESQSFFIPCIYTGKNFNDDLGHQTLTQAQIIFKNNIKYKLGNIYYEIKYDQKLINLILKIKFGLLSKLIPNFFKKRIFVITGFVNSNHSIYSAKIRKEDLRFDVIENKENKKKIKYEISNQLKVLEKNFNFLYLKLFFKLGNFGRGFHMGGSMPMLDESKIKQIEKNDLYTKKNGEIMEYKNVFIIDSTNFTNIPAGSMGLTIMANALRIAIENSND